MVWYLRVPLYRKYLAVKPVAYPIWLFSPDKRYLLSEHDFLVGTAAPNYKVKLIFTAGTYKKTVKVSDKGNWVAQLPSGMLHKPYRLTVAQFDTNNKLATVESYKVLVQSEAKFYQTTFYKYYLRQLLPTTVRAAEPKVKVSASASATPKATPAIISLSSPTNWSQNFTEWVNQAQSLGIYPYCELNGDVDPTCSADSDILLTSYQTYANVCQQAVNCYVSSGASTRISTQIDPVLFQSIATGDPVGYAAVAATLEPVLPVAPPYQKIVSQLSDTTPQPLNKDEQALLDKADGESSSYIPYVQVVSSAPQNQ